MMMMEAVFKGLEAVANCMGENKDCAVKAVAIVTGTSYENAHAHLEANGRKRRDGTLNHITQKTLRDLGFKTVRVKVMAKTVATIEEELACRGGTYLVWTKNHILAVKDGVVRDWTRGRKHHIKRVERVVPRLKTIWRIRLQVAGDNHYTVFCLDEAPTNAGLQVAVSALGLRDKLVGLCAVCLRDVPFDNKLYDGPLGVIEATTYSLCEAWNEP